MKDFISAGSRSRSSVSNLTKGLDTAIWSSKKIQKILDDHENGLIDIKTLKKSPFKDNDPAWKKANIPFEYTPEEYAEIERCKADPIYFIEKYCQVMTDDGIRNIGLFDYQREIIKTFKKEKFNILMASRQVGKTIMSGAFIVWFMTFHTDKNILVVADIAPTTKEVVDKIKTIFENLPFFLKPGCINNNVMSLKFDNGCRLIGRTTTKKTGIGFTIHLLYIDEFAHISAAYLDFFYRSVYPTAARTSKIIITSTPNGQNMFYELFMGALEGKNKYVPLQVDWWQYPGRDEAWRQDTIANIGSEENFNQEYGLQFFSSDRLLLNTKEQKKINSIKTQYIPHSFILDPDDVHLLDGLVLHPKLADMTPSDIRNDGNYYLFSIDTADGLNKDYSIINIWKLTHMPLKMIHQVKEHIKSEYDTLCLVQVGMLRSNRKDINEFTRSLEFLVYRIFNHEKVRLVIELNHKGDYIKSKLEDSNDLFWEGQMIATKHTESSVGYKPGVKLTSVSKIKICERFKYYLSLNKILPNEFKTVKELGSFGRSTGGSYRGQSGNDDLAMTCVTPATFFESSNFYELADSYIDTLMPKSYKDQLRHEIFNEDFFKGGKSGYDTALIKEVNQKPAVGASLNKSTFNQGTVDAYQKMIQHFYGSNGTL